MRKLITIIVLLSFIGCIKLAGQDAPMLVAGKVHVSGPLYSQGAVHVETVTVDSAMIDIDNGIGGATAILATDTIIFYSNDSFEGLLRNLNPSANGGVAGTQLGTQPSKVIVRKTFTSDIHTYFSLPFDVATNSVFKGNTSIQMVRGVSYSDPADYWSWELDLPIRSTYQGFSASGVWRTLIPTDKFYAGTGYQFWYNGDNPGNVVDFVTTDPTAIKNIFAYSSKDINYTMYRTSGYDPFQEAMDAGWVFIGGLNSTVFTFKQANVGGYTGGTVYYRNTRNSQTTGNAKYNTYSEFVLGKDDVDYSNPPFIIPAKTLNVGPYTPFYIQGNIPTAGTASGKFTFNTGGLLLDDITFRSSKDETGAQDQLYFALSSDKDNSSDRFYLDFDKSYSESYRVVEDAVKMSTAFEERPAVWSLQDGVDAALVVSGLPMKDGREVRMGFSVPEAGNYTISLAPLQKQDVRNVILVDNTAGKKVDLMQEGSYSFNTGAVEGETGRFVLYINSSYTGTPIIGTNEPYAYVKDNVLTVKNLTEGDHVQVLDLAGRTIATGTVSGKEFSVAVGQRGVYVVNVKGEKTSVLKALNK